MNFVKNFCTVQFIFIGLILFCGIYSSASALTATYQVTDGYDVSTGVPERFTSGDDPFSDIQKLQINDLSRIQSNADSWTIGDGYDESKYLEFLFEPSIPENAIIETVVLRSDFRRSSILSGAKYKIVTDSGLSQDFPIVVMPPSANTDQEELINITSIANTPQKINSMKAWFLAYRPVGGGGNTKTSHDLVEFTVTYSVPGVPPLDDDPTPDPEPDPDPESQDDTGNGNEEDTTQETDTETPPEDNGGGSSNNSDTGSPPVTVDYVGFLSDGNLLIIDLPVTYEGSEVLTLSLPDFPVRGSVSVIQGNRIVYTRTEDTGPDMFQYKFYDSHGVSNTSTVFIRESRESLDSIDISIDNETPTVSDSVVLTFTAKDYFGNVVTSDNSTVLALDIDTDGVLGAPEVVLNSGIASTTISKPTVGSVVVHVAVFGLQSSTVTVTFIDPPPVPSPPPEPEPEVTADPSPPDPDTPIEEGPISEPDPASAPAQSATSPSPGVPLIFPPAPQYTEVYVNNIPVSSVESNVVPQDLEIIKNENKIEVKYSEPIAMNEDFDTEEDSLSEDTASNEIVSQSDFSDSSVLSASVGSVGISRKNLFASGIVLFTIFVTLGYIFVHHNSSKG